MSFKDPTALLWLLALLPVIGGALLAVSVVRRRRATLLGGLAERLAPGFSPARRLLRDGLCALALGLVVLALAGPLLGTWMREVQQRGVDVMIVLDVSRSMLAEDTRPSRLERAKREVRGLLEHLAGDRVGLVTFAGDARLQCPLTHDVGTFRMFLDDADPTSNALGGTAVGEGLELALQSFDDEYPAESVIVLLTDGEDHTSDPPPQEVAYKALARGIPVHVVAFGTREGATIAVADERGGFSVVHDPDGQAVISRPDEDLLELVAGTGGGAFLSADRVPFPLDELYGKRIAVMPGVTRASSQREEGIDRFQWALVLALLCLGLREVVRDGRSA